MHTIHSSYVQFMANFCTGVVEMLLLENSCFDKQLGLAQVIEFPPIRNVGSDQSLLRFGNILIYKLLKVPQKLHYRQTGWI